MMGVTTTTMALKTRRNKKNPARLCVSCLLALLASTPLLTVFLVNAETIKASTLDLSSAKPTTTATAAARDPPSATAPSKEHKDAQTTPPQAQQPASRSEEASSSSSSLSSETPNTPPEEEPTGLEGMSATLEVTADDFDANKCPVYDGPGDFVILAFYARWCDNSRRFMKTYDAMARLFEREGGNYTLAKMDAEDNSNLPLTRHYKVRGYPSLFYFHKKEEKPYTRTDHTEIKKLFDAGKVQPALFVKWIKKITDDVFAEAGVGQPHDEF
ncbi:hypothetical protein PPROV_000724600 [Pycnococcus provasolii]|uniref:Thioredoxin domain-containing protein n=2 Tax=Pycnococcus provasolii TaxID=41880 RepID=A0A830HNK3_9CHLO|nr:hypothetical protein PPROV_000724600 [Pycnococcus provasolii]